MDNIILPPWLRRGDTIGITCPAGPVRDQSRVEAGLRRIEDLGFTVKVCGSFAPVDGYLAADDAQRAAWLHELWQDESVKAIMAVRGGFGCMRLLDLLDWQLFARHPKWLMGFSDLTVLLQGMCERAHLVSVHGPMVGTLLRDTESTERLFQLLTGTFAKEMRPSGLEILRGGTGQGRMVGGNLATLTHLLATPWDVSWQGKVVMLEDTNEPLYRLDRMLTQLALSGKLQGLAGLVLGEFDQGGDSLVNLRLQEALWLRVLELAGPGFPIWGGFPMGHLQRNWPLPLGMEVVMDSSAGCLRLMPDLCISV